MLTRASGHIKFALMNSLDHDVATFGMQLPYSLQMVMEIRVLLRDHATHEHQNFT